MRHAHEDSELRELVHRYVVTDRRYLRLGGSLLRLEGRERTRFAQELAEAAEEITPRELGILLDGGWRERKVAAWLIAVAGRTTFRDRLGQLLLASEVCYAGEAYCIALAAFGTAEDAVPLIDYLDRYLARPYLHYDQPFAIGALLHLDATRATGNATRFLTPHGPWARWNAGRDIDPRSFQRIVGSFCEFAAESSRYRASA
ncbi:DUF6000 family protein [Streptomyces sp. NPDC017993]|uniref:DUF6000 family protein n=1 Tax=Streptomyces sp. NPDC017993 TaxID=3365027 RepID=UPI00379E00DB